MVTRQPDNGTIAGPGAGDTVHFTPDANFNGFDSFDVRVSDGTNSSNATFAIQVAAVNDAPTVVGESREVLEDGFVDVQVLANDTDVDGDALSIQAPVGSAAHGSTELLAAASTIRYRPSLNSNFSDSFQYTVRDGNGGFTNGTVTIQVLPVNDPPVAQDQNPGTQEDLPVSVGLGASDPDTPAANFIRSIVSGPAHGTLGPIVGTNVTYTPNANFNGVDTFRFKVSDGQLDSHGHRHDHRRAGKRQPRRREPERRHRRGSGDRHRPARDRHRRRRTRVHGRLA